jgi:hypothetical protein
MHAHQHRNCPALLSRSRVFFTTLRISLQVLLNRKRIAEKGNLLPDVVPMVRIPPNARERNQWVIKQALDTGVYGLVLPHLSTVEDAQAAVAAARYPQVPGVQDFARAGERGWGNRIASRYWGLSPQEYYDAADLWPLDPAGNILLMGIIEEAEGVQNIRDILRQVRGIGTIWAGPETCRCRWDCEARPAIQPCKKICCASWPPAKSSAFPVRREPRLMKWRCASSKAFGSS